MSTLCFVLSSGETGRPDSALLLPKPKTSSNERQFMRAFEG